MKHLPADVEGLYREARQASAAKADTAALLAFTQMLLKLVYKYPAIGGAPSAP